MNVVVDFVKYLSTFIPSTSSVDNETMDDDLTTDSIPIQNPNTSSVDNKIMDDDDLTTDSIPIQNLSLSSDDARPRDDLKTDSVPVIQNEHSKGDHQEKTIPIPTTYHEFYDVGLLYHEDDYGDVSSFMNNLKRHVGNLRIDLFDNISKSEQQFRRIEELIERCSCIILYLTKNFLKDTVLVHQSNEILINTINCRTKTWNLMITVNENFPLPVGMKSLTYTKLFGNPEFAMMKLKRAAEDAQRKRVIKEREYASKPRVKTQVPSQTPSNRNLPNANKTIVHNTIININAEYVQAGSNPKMYGVCPNPSDTEPEECRVEQTKSPEIQSQQPIGTETSEEGRNIEYNISGPIVQINLKDSPTDIKQ